jgi:outer membrane protein TolC
MLTLIKLIYMLNSRIVNPVSPQPRANILLKRVPRISAPSQGQRNTAIRLQVCILVLMSCGGLSLETANGTTLDFAGIDRSLQLHKSNQVTSDNRSPLIAQKTPTPPPPTAPPSSPNIKLPNDLNLPRTGNEVKITGRQAITLQQAIEIAFRNNRQVQVARLTVDRSRQSVNLAQSAQSVRVGLQSDLTNAGSSLIFGNGSSALTTSGSTTSANGAATARYTILDAGRNQSSVRAAEEQVRFDQLDLVRVEQQVRSLVITAYYDLQAADSSIIISQASVRDATRSLSDAQLQERAGVGTRFDILTAQVQLATANQNLTNAQSQQQTARKNLAQILVVDNNTEFTAADAVRELGTWKYSLEDSIILAFKNRPEAEQQLVSRRINQQQQNVASAANSAQVDLIGSYGLGKSLTASTPLQDNYSVGVQLTWNFLDGGAANANTNIQKVNETISENQFTSTRNQIRFQVEQAYFSLGSSQKNIATSTQALTQAEESLKLARLRFQAGVGTQTDVINAQTALATARGNRVTAILNYNRALANLRTATVVNE